MLKESLSFTGVVPNNRNTILKAVYDASLGDGNGTTANFIIENLMINKKTTYDNLKALHRDGLVKKHRGRPDWEVRTVDVWRITPKGERLYSPGIVGRGKDIEACLINGKRDWRYGNYRGAMNYFKAGLILANGGFRELAGELHTAIGNILAEQNSFEDGLEHYEKAKEQFDDEPPAQWYANVAYFHVLQENWREAINHYDMALSLNPSGIVKALCEIGLGTCYAYQGNDDGAKACIRAALGCKVMEDTVKMVGASIYRIKGIIQRNRGNVVESRKLFRTGMKIFEEEGLIHSASIMRKEIMTTVD